ncbi:MAG: DNA cytosine methyltransferase [Candidatus Thiodiazotropha sp. (ex. Lucinisca nassula)]|nr:DNA cytosine methyltransferase [Candidatus Thiodiazotropha sp. (ex. Lucinisca nassula)]MBW9273870.1 DNA cytosine methyltransferase [Candidatus Thiodiazotropha sp. (ex. Lucinisca nassula)]
MIKDVSCVDLFCGAGGLTHGFIIEGLPVNAGIDLDPACKYPYEENNDSAFIEQDVANMDSEEVATLFSPGTIRVLAGCAPCQPFSTYSQRYDTSSDDKWSLLEEFGRLAEGIRPDIITMENVPTLARHKVFKDFVTTLKDLDYQLWYDVVECAQYGVPQTRKRLVLMASLHGPIEIIEPTHSKPVTVKKAIGRLRAIDAGERAPRDRLHTAASLSSKNLARIRASKPGGTWRDWPKRLIADCHKEDTGRTYPSVYGRMVWDKPAPTMTTQCYGYGNGRFGHPEQDRAISLREAAILQSFPRSYKFIESDYPIQFKTIGRMIGNAVPVGLGRAIAVSIIRHLKEENIKPSRCRGKGKRKNH